jgi:hypothetical protein
MNFSFMVTILLFSLILMYREMGINKKTIGIMQFVILIIQELYFIKL